MNKEYINNDKEYRVVEYNNTFTIQLKVQQLKYKTKSFLGLPIGVKFDGFSDIWVNCNKFGEISIDKKSGKYYVEKDEYLFKFDTLESAIDKIEQFKKGTIIHYIR